MIALDPATSALVLIDLQNGIVGLPLAPRDGLATLAACTGLAACFRQSRAAVVLVRVAFEPDFSDAPPGVVDQPMSAPTGDRSQWSAFAHGLEQPGDIVITKRQWGAFTGTALDTLLRRRGIRTLVIGGIATNFGVESTARHGWELGYNIVVPEDACASMSAELHDVSVTRILPRIARVTRTANLSLAA